MTRSRSALNIAACLAVLHTVNDAQLSAQRPIETRRGNIALPAITRPVETTGEYRLAADHFRGSVALSVINLPTTNRTGLQGILVKWAPFPGAERYQLLRSASASGPWTSLHEGPELTHTMNPAPLGVRMFTRVVALKRVGETYVTLDTSVLNDVMSGGRFHPHDGLPINGQNGFPDPRCASQAPLTAVIHWPPVPFAGAYVMRIVRIDSTSSRRLELATQTVRDTLATFTEGNDGVYLYSVRVRFDFPAWTAPGDTLHQLAGQSDPAVGKVNGGLFTCIH